MTLSSFRVAQLEMPILITSFSQAQAQEIINQQPELLINQFGQTGEFNGWDGDTPEDPLWAAKCNLVTPSSLISLGLAGDKESACSITALVSRICAGNFATAA